MKKLLLILLAIIVIVVAVAVVAPFLIPTETYKTQIAKQVESQTGRQLEIAGDLSLSLLPRVQFTAGQVRFANADWAEQAEMARFERMQVRVNPLALLSGELQVESFVLRQPVIHLAKRADGRTNWQFGQPGEAPSDGAPAGDGGGTGTGPLKDIGLQDVRLVDGTVTYADAAGGQSYTFDNVNMSVALTGLDQPLTAEGEVTWNGETVKVDLETGAPRQLMAGAPTLVTLDVASDPVTLGFDGEVTNADPRRIAGEVDLGVPSLKRLASWAGTQLDAPEGALETFRIAGRVEAEGPTYSFAAEEIVFDKIRGKGDLTVATGGKKPELTGRLALAQMDITPYLPEPTEETGGGQQGGADGAAGAGQPADWSDAPIDLDPLHAANADFDLSVEGITARDVEIGRSALALELRNGRLQADLTELNLYDGSGTGRIVVNGRGNVPKISKVFQLKNLQARPFLTDVAGFERLEGTGALQIDVAASGKSQKALVNDLDGTGAVNFQDGAIVGINLAAMVRNVKSAFQGGGETQKTDFALLSGTFDIKDGVLTNDDLLLMNPLLRVRGEGRADIGARTVAYRLTPKAVASTEGQGGQVRESGVAVPVIVEGPWHDVSYRPDLKSMIQDAVKNPEQIKKTLDKVKEGGDVRKVLEGLGGQTSGSAGTTDGGDTDSGGTASDPAKQLEDKAKEGLKKLFGN